jgi:hypothetical protein
MNLRALSLCALGIATSGLIRAEGDYLAGYMIIPTANRIDKQFGGGFSMYVAAWPLLNHYPGHQFQTGLPGTWMFAQYEGEKPKDLYSDVEGGLGWWRDTRFPTVTPKFIMGGVAPNFSEIANGPAHGWGTWDKPRGLYGVAQLSPWLLFPIDGLNVKQGTCGELFGYGYLPLPLTEKKAKTAGQDFPTGNHSWTLFLSTGNFKGPVAFFTPYFWSSAGLREDRYREKLLDLHPAEPNTAIQMETQYIPCKRAVDSKGQAYIRIAPTSFPENVGNQTVLLHQPTSYAKTALWDAVESWFKGGKPVTKGINPDGVSARHFKNDGYMTWEIHTPQRGQKDKRVPIAWKEFAQPASVDGDTFGVRWASNLVTNTLHPQGKLKTFPEYFRLENPDDPKKERWVPVSPSDVPDETGLKKIVWQRPTEKPEPAYDTPEDKSSSWKTPGPAAGPFEARLGDGSTVTYYWYRFADQPALLNADLTKAEREEMQRRVELLHRTWTKEKTYLALPKNGAKLADLDPAQIVKPPKGMEIGYVPIAVRQVLKKK